eukprot:TRINITY_DN8876_c0_g1_i3.p1 TRINITY_DN8876_c0_g1~~TRINITY_DN8876_c0_g1_i3.p1  ORF type:complete len:436 (-),score=71.54 TRINITY_DN8876_c0_g1_i3:12-1319(-)
MAWTDRFPKLLFPCISFFLLVLPLVCNQPVGPLIIAVASGNNTSKASLFAGLTIALNSFCCFIAAPIIGILSDKYGRKPFIALSIVSSAISLGGFLIIYMVPSQAWILYITSVLAGLSSSIFGILHSYVADISTPENRGRSFGFLGASAGLAIIVGPAIGGLAGKVSYALPAVIGLSFGFINVLLGVFVHPESKEASNEPIDWRKDNTFTAFHLLWTKKQVFALCFPFCINQMTTFGIIAASTLYYKDIFGWGAFEIGLSMSVYGLALVLSQALLVKPLVAKIGDKNTVLLTLFIMASVAIPYALIKNGWWLFAVIPLKGFASISIPIIQGVLSKQYPQEVQGKVMNILGGLQTLSGFVGPLVFSGLLSYFTAETTKYKFPQVIWYACAGLEFVALGLAYLTFRLYPETEVYKPVETEEDTTEKFIIDDEEMEQL